MAVQQEGINSFLRAVTPDVFHSTSCHWRIQVQRNFVQLTRQLPRNNKQEGSFTLSGNMRSQKKATSAAQLVDPAVRHRRNNQSDFADAGPGTRTIPRVGMNIDNVIKSAHF